MPWTLLSRRLRPAAHPAGRVAAALTAVMLCAPRPAQARALGHSQPADDVQVERSMQIYKEGLEHFRAGEYERALANFQEASALYASPAFQYNIGRCYEELGRNEDAVRAFEIYLKAKPDAPDSGDVRERIGRLRGLAEAERKAAEQAKQTEQAEDDDDGEPQADPEPVSPPVAAVDEPPSRPGRPLVISGAVLLGVGAALALGGGIGFGVLARQRSDELDEIQTGGNPEQASLAEAEEVESEGRAAELGQIGTAAAGSAIAIAGVVLVVLGTQRNKKGQTAANAVQLVPRWSRHGAGLALSGRF